MAGYYDDFGNWVDEDYDTEANLADQGGEPADMGEGTLAYPEEGIGGPGGEEVPPEDAGFVGGGEPDLGGGGGGGFLGGLGKLFGGPAGGFLAQAGLKGLERAFQPKPQHLTSMRQRVGMSPEDQAAFNAMFQPAFAQAGKGVQLGPEINPGELPTYDIPGAPSPVGGRTNVQLRSPYQPAQPANSLDDMRKNLAMLGVKF